MMSQGRYTDSEFEKLYNLRIPVPSVAGAGQTAFHRGFAAASAFAMRGLSRMGKSDFERLQFVPARRFRVGACLRENDRRVADPARR